MWKTFKWNTRLDYCQEYLNKCALSLNDNNRQKLIWHLRIEFWFDLDWCGILIDALKLLNSGISKTGTAIKGFFLLFKKSTFPLLAHNLAPTTAGFSVRESSMSHNCCSCCMWKLTYVLSSAGLALDYTLWQNLK